MVTNAVARPADAVPAAEPAVEAVRLVSKDQPAMRPPGVPVELHAPPDAVYVPAGAAVRAAEHDPPVHTNMVGSWQPGLHVAPQMSATPGSEVLKMVPLVLPWLLLLLLILCWLTSARVQKLTIGIQQNYLNRVIR